MTVINFVWIGEPKFDKGGQDVLGPESFDLNFKKFPQDMPNSIVFWCQACCVERYDAFFKSKGVTIEVKSIEHYLETCQIVRENAAFIQQEYTKIILDPARNKIIDRVYFKDMFFNFILATQGNYVLDDSPRSLPVRDTTYWQSLSPSCAPKNEIGGRTRSSNRPSTTFIVNLANLALLKSR